MDWTAYAQQLRSFIEDPANEMLLTAASQRIHGNRPNPESCVFELTSGRLQREFLTLWPLLDDRQERDRCLDRFALKAREIRDSNPFSVMVTCTATSRIIMENVHAEVETKQDRVNLYYLGHYPYLGAESASPLVFDEQRVLIVTDVIASATLVKDLARYVRERGGKVAAVLCVVVIDPTLCAETAKRGGWAVLPEKEVPKGHKQVPIYSLTSKPIEYLSPTQAAQRGFDSRSMQCIRIDARTVSPRIRKQLNGHPPAQFKPDEVYPLLERAQALDFGFFKAGNRLFTTGVRIGRLLDEDPRADANANGQPEHDPTTGPLHFSASGTGIWKRISQFFVDAPLSPAGHPCLGRQVMVTTYNREDLRFRDFIDDQLSACGLPVPQSILIPRAESIEMPEAYDWLEQHQETLDGADVLLLLASARSSENLWRMSSVLASIKVRSISVVCLINRMGPTTLDFVQRVRKLLGDPRPITDQDSSAASATPPPSAPPHSTHEVQFSFHPIFNLPDLPRDDLVKMQTAVKTLLDQHCAHTVVESFRVRSNQTRSYFEPRLTTSLDFEGGTQHPLKPPFSHPPEPQATPITVHSWEAKLSLLVRYLVYSEDHDPLIREIDAVSRYEEMVDLLRVFLSELDFLKISGRFANLRCALLTRLIRSHRERYDLETRARCDGAKLLRADLTARLQLESWLIFSLALFSCSDQRFDYRALLLALLHQRLPLTHFDPGACEALEEAIRTAAYHPDDLATEELKLLEDVPLNVAMFFENDGIAWALSVLLHFSMPTPDPSSNGDSAQPRTGQSDPRSSLDPGAEAIHPTRPEPCNVHSSLTSACEWFLARLQNDKHLRSRSDRRLREGARKNLHLLLKELRIGSAKRRHETIRHLQAQLMSTPQRHHPIESSLQEAIDDIDDRFQKLDDRGIAPTQYRKIRFTDPGFKNHVQDAMHAAATLSELVESANDLFSFTSVVPRDAERFLGGMHNSGFGRDVTRLIGLLQRARREKAISRAEFDTFRTSRTTLLEDLFDSESPLRSAVESYVSVLPDVLDKAWKRAGIELVQKDYFPVDVLAAARPTVLGDIGNDWVLVERTFLHEVLKNIFLNTRYTLQAYADRSAQAEELARQGNLFSLWTTYRPEDEMAPDRETLDHVNLHFQAYGEPFSRPDDWDTTTLAKHQRQLLELGGDLRIEPLTAAPHGPPGVTSGTNITLTLISRNRLKPPPSKADAADTPEN